MPVDGAVINETFPEPEQCACGLWSRGLVAGVCADCRDTSHGEPTGRWTECKCGPFARSADEHIYGCPLSIEGLARAAGVWPPLTDAVAFTTKDEQ